MSATNKRNNKNASASVDPDKEFAKEYYQDKLRELERRVALACELEAEIFGGLKTLARSLSARALPVFEETRKALLSELEHVSQHPKFDEYVRVRELICSSHDAQIRYGLYKKTFMRLMKREFQVEPRFVPDVRANGTVFIMREDADFLFVGIEHEPPAPDDDDEEIDPREASPASVEDLLDSLVHFRPAKAVDE